jgi:four helix bundle protein
MSVVGYRKLLVWQKAMDLVVESYQLAERLPSHERYGLASQIRRAAASVPANIAEGNGRAHRGDYIHHVSIARGSIMELETLVEIALRLNYLSEEDVARGRELSDHVSRMLNRLGSRLKP